VAQRRRQVLALAPPLLAAAGNQAVGALVLQADDRDLMIDKYGKELANGAWAAAVTTLVGFNEPDIDRMLRDRTQNWQLMNLRAAAVTIQPGGQTTIIQHIDKLLATRAAKPGQELATLQALFEETMAASDYEQAAALLMGINGKDPKKATASAKAIKSGKKPDITKLTLLKIRGLALFGPGGIFLNTILDPIIGFPLSEQSMKEGRLAHMVATRDWTNVAHGLTGMDAAQRALTACRVRRTDMAAAHAGIEADSGAEVAAQFTNANDGKVADPTHLFLESSVWPLDQLIAAFEHRWAVDLAGTWGRGSLRTAWSQLDRLPPAHVAPGTALTLLTGIEGRVSTESTKVVEVAQGGDIASAIRHEVAHALHENQPAVVDGWLAKMGFRALGDADTGFNALIGALGGYPKSYVDAAGQKHPFRETDRQMVDFAIVNHTNTTGTFKAGAKLPKVGGPEHIDRLWTAMPQKVRTCFELSADNWFTKYDQFPKGMFWNHYYGIAYSMSERVKAVVTAAGNSYAAMSDKEFFATCYENFFASSTTTGPPKYGGTMPPDVAKFFTDNFLPPTPTAPRKNKSSLKK